MKRLLIGFIIILLICSPRIYWSLKESKPLTINVVDKTVPKKDYREHNGLFQVLTYEKVTDSSGELYDIGKDYFGFDPYDEIAGPTYEATSNPDLIYIADTYGVYSDDLEDQPEGERSTLLDGGMTLLEWNTIMDSKTEATTLIAEFNSFASPTEPAVSSIMQQNLGVHWSGWIGRYFPDFENEEIPAWLIADYEKQYNEAWAFENDGLAFVHSAGDVVILDQAANKDNVLFTPSTLGEEQFPKMRSAPYNYWFDIIEPLEGADVLAHYSLSLTEQGTEQLQVAGIPTDFPAIVHTSSTKTYYFAGDYADFQKRAFVKWQLFPNIYPYFATGISEFYWKSYFPLLSDIITQISEEKVR